jgi:hypothetical protein
LSTGPVRHGENKVRLQALNRAPLPHPEPAVSVKLGQKSCVIKLIKLAYTLSAQSLVKHPLKGDEAAGLHMVGAEPSEALTEGQQSQ